MKPINVIKSLLLVAVLLASGVMVYRDTTAKRTPSNELIASGNSGAQVGKD